MSFLHIKLLFWGLRLVVPQSVRTTRLSAVVVGAEVPVDGIVKADVEIHEPHTLQTLR